MLRFLLALLAISLRAKANADDKMRSFSKLEYPAEPRNRILYIEQQHSGRSLQQLPPFQPMRILLDTRVLESRYGQGHDAEIDSLVNTYLPLAAQRWERHLSVRRLRDSRSFDADICGPEYEEFLQERITYDADLVIFVGGDPQGICDENALAFAQICALDALERPMVGAMNVCLGRTGRATQGSTRTAISDAFAEFTSQKFAIPEPSILDTAIHEMGHVLGIHAQMFAFFRDDDFNARTPRRSADNYPIVSRQCGNGTVATGALPGESTISVLEVNDKLQQFLVTPRVRQIVRNHFNCQELLGARLEEDDRVCFGTHWHERDYYNALMSPVTAVSGLNDLSLLTLATLDDSGWYQVDYRGGVSPSFGLAAGCGFIDDPCIFDGEYPNGASVQEFCTSTVKLKADRLALDFEPTSLHAQCDPGHLTWNACDLFDHSEILFGKTPDKFYFKDQSLAPGFFQLADNCPIPTLGLGLNCMNHEGYFSSYPGEEIGEHSRCINAYYERFDGVDMFLPACMKVSCDAEERVVRLGQGEDEVVCRKDAQEIKMPRRENATFVCPRLAAVCPEMYTCPHGCFGRGVCVYPGDKSAPYCKCDDAAITDAACAPEYIDRAPTAAVPQPPTRPTGQQPTAPRDPTIFRPTPRPPVVDPASSAFTRSLLVDLLAAVVW